MATVVEIADTELPTYSPLNEKHNILYHRIRHIINERHVQRPWFDLNPLIDSRDDQQLDLDAYRPDNNLDFRQLESLAVVEDYFSDKPVFTREFSISEFWDYVNSDDWADGYSIRVLEGRLQNLILTTISSLVHTEAAVQHSTVAYAKSRRHRHPVYKHTEKAIEMSRLMETLLLEFIYYGIAVRPYLETETSSLGYPGNTTTALSSLSEELESSDADKDAQRVPAVPYPRPPPGPAGPQPGRHKRLQRNTRVITRSAERQKRPSNKPLSRLQDEENVTLPRRGIQASISNTFSEGEWEYIPPTVDLSKFMCTEKVSYLGEFDLSDDSSSDSDDDTGDQHYGQEFYLGETMMRQCEMNEPVAAKLKKRKEVVKRERAERRQQIAECRRPVKSVMPEFSELDINKYLSHAELNSHKAQTNMDTVPDFLQFIQMMRQEEKPQLTDKAQVKQRCIKTRKKYKVIRPEHEKFGDYVGGVTDSSPCKLHCYSQRDATWQALKQTTKKNYMIKKLLAAGGKVQEKPKKKKKKEVKAVRELQIPFIYITTVTGITYLHPVSKLMIRSKDKSRIVERTQPGSGRRRASLVPSSPITLSHEIARSRRTSASTRSSPESLLLRRESPRLKAKFPKANDVVAGVESPDFESDDESDSLDMSPFDTKKLNIRYSIERIRAKKAGRKKKTATFHNVLRKYCRMQSILKAFSPAGKRRMSVYGQPIMGMRPMRRRRKTMAMLAPVETQNPVTVGKLKWFPFLDAVRKQLRPANSDTELPLFDNYPMDVFRQKVVQALQDFVVRREVVISDLSAKASVSVTFTRKQIFTKSKGLSA